MVAISCTIAVMASFLFWAAWGGSEAGPCHGASLGRGMTIVQVEEVLRKKADRWDELGLVERGVWRYASGDLYVLFARREEGATLRAVAALFQRTSADSVLEKVRQSLGGPVPIRAWSYF